MTNDNEAKLDVQHRAPVTAQIDDRECRAASERVTEQASRLRIMLQQAWTQPYYGKAYAGHSVESIQGVSDLEKLPVLRKQDLVDIQEKSPPFGGLLSAGAKPDYLFVSPGPIHEPGFMKPEFWRTQRALRAAGFQSGDIVHNTFSYHLTPGAWILDAGARAMGCAVIPAGNAAMELHVTTVFQYEATAYVGTPDFLKTLIEACLLADRGPLPLKKAVVSGGALTPGLRQFFQDSGLHVLQFYATAELGLIAYETEPSGLMVVDEDVIVEIVEPGTGIPAAVGEVGEVVVTTLRDDYPLVRFGTGDLSAFVDKPRQDGRTGPVLAGWLGRADEATKVRGMFVRPGQIASLCDRVKGLKRARLIISRTNEKDDVILFCEYSDDYIGRDTAEENQMIREVFRDICHLNTSISIVEPGTLSDDGKLIVDMR
ncbi:phenylacetate--CoA ligase family protein [Granulosicoccus antarcticus]|uniref:Phenylacetate-coenzyme A ligase n=1 Tax=Granulosicoccus antarcticus IMCC3135 TaxID=1192854 RepID=A0A2Z2NWU4_9GAMM|nr:AMP-binding protein [Granulosicoccus antarcticus]ASJ74471.1 Phenylacetate-coenzyme A ligase [Granulosicoccus antarcticus IMCC3135]